MKNKKAQISFQDAPNVVLIVGLTFLMLATLAYIGLKFGDAVATDTTATVTNETLNVTLTTKTVAKGSLRNVICTFNVITNSSGQAVAASNYTISNCQITGKAGPYLNTNWNLSYTYIYDNPTAATNVTNDLNTEISANTSIAGIVLTISLVGIVLSVLIGIFVVARNRGM